MEGFIKVYRKLLDWEWIGCPEMVCLWVNILLRANSDEKVVKGITVGRGQLLTSRATLARQCGISEKKVRTCLERLTRANQVAKQSANGTANGTAIITVLKYEDYQDKRPSSRPSNRPTERPTVTSDKGQKQEEKKEELLTNVRNSSIKKESIKKESDPKFLKFQDWVKRHAPAVAAMPKPFTEGEFLSIMSNFPAEAVRDVLEDMNDWVPLKNKKSAYRTCLKWLKNRREKPSSSRPLRSKISEAFEEMIKTGSDLEATERLI